MNKNSRLLQADISLFLIIAIVIFLVWSLLIQLPISSLYGVGDTFALVAHYADMVRLGPLSDDLLYSSTRIGGAVLSPVDMQVYHQLFSFFNVHPMLAINLSIILTQTLVAFFGIKILQLIQQRDAFSWSLNFYLIILFSFTPAMAWRMVWGHLNLIWGMLWAVASIYQVLALARKKVSVIGSLSVLMVFCHSLQCLNLAQSILNSIIVSGILILFNFKSFMKLVKEHYRYQYSLLVLLAAAFSFALVNLVNTYHYLPELNRQVTHDAIYTYNVQGFIDFIGSIFYSFKTFETDRNYYLLHETNLGFGALPIILFALLPHLIKNRIYQATIAIFVFGIVLSSNIPLLSDGILTLLPILKAFRCPSRIFIPIIFLLTLQIGWIISRWENSATGKKDFFPLLVFFFISIVFSVFDLNIDLLAFPLMVIVGILITLRSDLVVKHGQYAISILVAFNVLGFKDKVPPQPFTIEQYQDSSRRIEHVPLTNELLRHYTSISYSAFGVNQGAVYNYSSIDGYVMGPTRFNEFYQAVNPDANFLTNSYSFFDGFPGFAKYARIFNVTHEIRMSESALSLVELRADKPVWSPSKIEFANNAGSVFWGLQKDEDTAFMESRYLSSLSDVGPCEDIKLLYQNERMARLDVTTKGKCLVVAATQYSSFLKAKSERQEFSVVPVNWIGTGIIVDDFSGEIVLKAESVLSGEIYFKILSVILFFVFILLNRFLGPGKNQIKDIPGNFQEK